MRPRTWGTEDVAGEYYGPNVLADVRGVQRTLTATLRARMSTVEHAGGSVTKDPACRDLMKAIRVMDLIESSMEQIAKGGDLDTWVSADE